MRTAFMSSSLTHRVRVVYIQVIACKHAYSPRNESNNWVDTTHLDHSFQQILPCLQLELQLSRVVSLPWHSAVTVPKSLQDDAQLS